MFGKKKNVVQQIVAKDIDLEDPTPFLNQAHLGCSQIEAEVDTQTKTSSQAITAWRYDTGSHAENVSNDILNLLAKARQN